MRLAAALTVYVATIVVANVLTNTAGLVPVGWGLLVPAGTFAAGGALLARDVVREAGGPRWRRWVFGAIAVGAVLSWALAGPTLALASAAAFTVAELIDLAVYEAARRRAGFPVAAVASNAISAPIDTVVFLALAPFPITWPAVLGQVIAKWVWATLLPVALYVTGRRVLRR